MTELMNPHSTPETDCFEECAPLSALGLLDPSEQQALEQHLTAHPELAPELVAYQAAAAALPYGLALPPAATLQALKPQLFERLGLSPPEPASTPQPSLAAAFMAVRSGDLRWQASPIPKVDIATLHINSERREQVGLLRAEPGMQYPPHTHGGTEEIYMLSGDLVLEGVSYQAGDYIRSAPQSHHAPAHSATGCLFFFRSSLDDEYPEQRV
jgi:anti-sigma factor ChrR (cupin superfamily)